MLIDAQTTFFATFFVVVCPAVRSASAAQNTVGAAQGCVSKCVTRRLASTLCEQPHSGHDDGTAKQVFSFGQSSAHPSQRCLPRQVSPGAVRKGHYRPALSSSAACVLSLVNEPRELSARPAGQPQPCARTAHNSSRGAPARSKPRKAGKAALQQHTGQPPRRRRWRAASSP